MQERRRTAWLLALAAALTVAAVIFDLSMPLGVAAGIPYVAVVLVGLWLPWRGAPVALAGSATALILAGYAFSAPGGVWWAVLENRLMAILALWAVALVGVRRRQADQALKRREADLRRAQRLAHLGSYQADFDTSRLIWSEETFHITGLDPQAGEPSQQEYQDTIVHPEDRERVRRTVEACRRDGRVFDYDYRIRRPDGDVRHVQSIGNPVRDGSGRVVKVVGTLLDITERKAAEAAVLEREARLQSVIETAPEGIITIAQDGTIESFSSSAQALFGYCAEEAVGQNVGMLMPSPDRERHDHYLQRYLETGEARMIGIGRVVEGRRKDGTTFPMELAVGEAEVGGARIFTGFVRDITDRRRMERELRQAQKMEAIGQLTGGVAHDFNNLLTVILGNLEMLEAELAEPRQRAALEQAQEAAELGAQLAGRLLAFARRQPLRPQRVDLSELVAETSDLLRRTLGEAIEVETVLASGLRPTMVDPGQLQNALLNLAINGRDAMPDGGRLLIRTANVTLEAEHVARHAGLQPGPYVMLSVSDTGDGMPPEVREHAFEPFFTTKEAGSGTGLGLSMVYGFVRQSGGHVRLDSEAGRGTTVSIYLPPAPVEEVAASPGQPDAGDYPARGETVLVVEDDARVRRLSISRLEELGYRVVEAGNATAALDFVADGTPFDLLFTDVVMPGGMAGGTLAEEVRQRRPDIKVIFTSGYAGPDLVDRGLREPGTGWLPKPFSKLELARTLREVFDAPQPSA